MQDLLQVIADIARTSVTDLRKRYDIHFRQLPTGMWEAVDYATYEDEGPMRIAGHGETTTEAVADLIAKLGEVVANGPTHYNEVASCSPYEPPTTRRVRVPSEDEE